MRRSLGGLAAALAFAALGCASGANLTVDLRTDYAAGEEFSAVRTELSTGAFASSAVAPLHAEIAVSPAADYLGGERVGEFRALAAGTYWVRVSLLGADGTVRADRTTVVQIHDTFSITAVVSRSCEGITCPPAGSPSLTSCNAGVCVEPHCAPETPEQCGPGECTRDADCHADMGECARAVCEGFACLYGGDDSLCDANEHCSHMLTCVPDARMTDAGQATSDAGGTSDASGTPDAGPPCGARNEPCCAAMTCDPGTYCTDTPSGQRCLCGGRTQVCCGGTRCDDGIGCFDTTFGPLCLCGQRNYPCCTGRLCDDGSFCLDTGFGPLCLCGTRDRPCCPGRACDDGSVCLDTGFGPLCLCGSDGRPCCSGTDCDAGLTCRATGFGPICQP